MPLEKEIIDHYTEKSEEPMRLDKFMESSIDNQDSGAMRLDKFMENKPVEQNIPKPNLVTDPFLGGYFLKTVMNADPEISTVISSHFVKESPIGIGIRIAENKPFLTPEEIELSKKHPIASFMGDVSGSVLTYSLASIIPGVGIPVAFGAAGALSKTAEIQEQPELNLKIGSNLSRIGVRAIADGITGKIFSTASQGKTILDRLLWRSSGAGASSISNSVIDQAIASQGKEIDAGKALLDGVFQAVTIGTIGALTEVPALRGLIIKEAESLSHKKGLSFEDAKAIVKSAGIEPEKLSPEFQKAAYEVKRQAALEEIDIKAKELGYPKDIIEQVIKSRNVRERDNILTNYLTDLAKVNPAQAEALAPFYNAIKNGADPVDILIAQEILKNLKPKAKIEQVIKTEQPVIKTSKELQPKGTEFQAIPEKIKPDLSGITPLQRQIQSMSDRLQRVEMAKNSLQEVDVIRENFKGRIKKYSGEFLKEELQNIPKYFITKTGGIAPDEALQELRDSFGIDLANESELKEYLINTEKARQDLLAEIETNKPELITKRETTLLNTRIKATEQGLREGKIQTKEDIKNTQTELIQLIEEAKLPLDERAKFLRAIKNIQTKENLAKELPKITERLRNMKKKELRDELINDIKKISQSTRSSESVAVEYSQLIQDVVNQFELQGHREDTIKGLQNTMNFIKQSLEEGKKVDMPEDVLDKLGILYRKPLKDITTEEMEDLRNTIEHLANLGMTKLRLRQMAYERKKAEALNKLKSGSRPIQSKEKIKAGIGERLTYTENLKNNIADKINLKMEKSIALTPMDAFIDELDGQKNYKGENYTNFKKPIDKDWSDYNKILRSFNEKIFELAEGMNESNFERIAAWSVIQEVSGFDKIEELGYKISDIENIVLTDKEKVLLDEMVKNYDKSFPMIKEVLRTIYNAPLDKVKFYYPYITDFDAMTDFEMRDRFINTPEYSKSLRKNPEMGFTKERTGGKQKIILNALEAYSRHMDNVAYLLTVGKDVKYLNDLASTEEYRKAVGDIGQEMMREWLDLIARKGRLAGERIPLLDTLRKLTGGANLAFKISSALIQPTALFDGASMIGNYAFEGTQMVIHKEIRQFLMDNFEEIRMRIGDDPAYMDFYQQKDIIDEAINIGLWPLKILDKLTASAVTIGAYKKYCIENDIEFDISKPNQDAIDYAQLILRRTQSSALFKDVALSLSKGKLTGNISFDKGLLQFQSFLLNRWSLITHDLYKAGIKGKNKKQALNIVFWLITATVAETLIRRGIREFFADEEKQKKEKSLAEDLILNTFQNIPFLGNVIGMIFYGNSGIASIDYVKNIFEEFGLAIKAKKEETKTRHIIKGVVSAFPGGSQIKQVLPSGKQETGLKRKSLKGSRLKR